MNLRKLNLNTEGLNRKLKFIESSQGPRITVGTKVLINFSSNDYLGLASDERLKKAAKDSIEKEGVGSGASRLICGGRDSHRKLESALADFKGTPQALVFNCGYMANVGIISALFDKGDIIFSDKLNHASILDGIILSRAELRRYPHKDMGALKRMLEGCSGYKRRCIITDSVFSMDGDIAPIDEIVCLAEKYDSIVMIDEAHAFGVFGKKGKGLAEHFGLEGKIEIQMGTLSKAAGATGGYVCSEESLISYLVNKSRSFIYTTAMPPSIAASACRAVEIIQTEPGLREKLWENTKLAIKGIKEAGFNTLDSASQIMPIIVGDEEKAVKFSKMLIEEGIFVAPIRHPSVPLRSSRLRVSITAAHNKEDIEGLINSLKKIGRKLCLI
ncbi:MAG: 8-amino-7-oxononanoate synthase [Candidatus Omnitrophica bacterium]|nr:8-amino-7-oxononanoate synthase [Candidatus Omnitrophota bacterium]